MSDTATHIAHWIGSFSDRRGFEVTLSEIRALPEINIRRASSPRLSYAVAS